MDDKKCESCGSAEHVVTTADGCVVCTDCAEWMNDGPADATTETPNGS